MNVIVRCLVGVSVVQMNAHGTSKPAALVMAFIMSASFAGGCGYSTRKMAGGGIVGAGLASTLVGTSFYLSNNCFDCPGASRHSTDTVDFLFWGGLVTMVVGAAVAELSLSGQ